MLQALIFIEQVDELRPIFGTCIPGALVQWLRLPKKERRTGNSLSENLVGLLTALDVEADEGNLIGSALAARLGLDLVYPIDDHSADSIISSLEPAYDKTMQEIWSAAERVFG